jgi:D-aspartate ligase
MPPVAIVMNMFYSGLGIARSLGEQGIPVMGLTSHRGIYGNFTRYARLRVCPDSREQPEALLAFLLGLDEIANRGIIFPTRDDDVLFLERFRSELQGRFTLAIPERSAVQACLNKWETYQRAQIAGVPVPRCWSVAAKADLLRIAPEVTYPCVLKPVSAHHWRQRDNWQTVGGRKAIAISSADELFAEYDRIATADSRVLLQEMVSGGDECLRVAACYLDRQSNFVAGFTAQKLIQVPEGFGTGCIVQTADCPELLATAAKLLREIEFSGIAEVEFKWDSTCARYKLIEINPRPWDQHRLGNACGVDLIHIAYCDAAGIALPSLSKPTTGHKWIAEDVLFWSLLRSLWRRDGKLRSLLRQTRGRRIYAIWSIKDPLPMLGFIGTRLGPEVMKTLLRYFRSLILKKTSPTRALSYESHETLEKRNAKT